jgi:cytochrome c biogenesis protein CcmG, thiol:disulfide interchange protein DsbE
MSEVETAAPAKRGIGAFAPLIVLALIVAAAAVVLFQGGTRRDLAATGLIGKPIPAYSLPALTGGLPVTPVAFAGKPYLVNAFASWCGPCKVEHPMLMQLAQSGVPILGVLYRDKPEAAAKFLEDLGNPFTAIGMDPQGRYGIEIGIMGVPETYVVDGQGRIRHIVRGPLTPHIIETRIMPLLTAAAEGR